MLDIGTTLLISIAMAIGSTAITSTFTRSQKALIATTASVFAVFMIVIILALETLMTVLVWTFFALLIVRVIIKIFSK